MPKEWGRHKGEIETLYILQGKTLKEVQRLLKGRHGFNASIRAYRMKLEEWDLRKYKSSALRGGASTRPQKSNRQSRSNVHESSAASFSNVIESGITPHPNANDLASQLPAHTASGWAHDQFGLPVGNSGDFGAYNFEPQLQNAASTSYFQRSGDIAFRDPSPEASLHAAISHGTEEELNDLLSSGKSVSEWNSKGNQPLHEAVIKGNVSMIKLLLKYGADVNSAGAEGKTPLHIAISSPEVLGLLLKKCPAVSLQDRARNTALHLLLQQEKWWMDVKIQTIINNLLSDGADINITNNAGYSAFHILVSQVEPHSDEYLRSLLNFLDHSPNISLPLLDGSLPFETLLKKLKPILRQLGTLTRILQSQFWEDKTEMQRCCLERFIALGANADTLVTEGSPLLHYLLEDSTILGRSKLGELVMLIIHNANANLAGYDGNCPLHQILCKPSSSFSGPPYSKLDYIKVLIGRKADVNQPNASGACPLELLLSVKNEAVSNMTKYCMALLEAGAVPMLITSKGKNIFDLVDEYVDESGRHKLLKALLEADLNADTEPANLANHLWAIRWRAACRETQWVVAKHLLQFEGPFSRPSSKTFLDCAYIVIAENLLKGHKAQLVRWQAGRLEHEAARHHRQEYVAILNDCNERQAAIEPSWYTYLLKIMDFG